MRINKSLILATAFATAAVLAGAPASAAVGTDVPGLEIGTIGYNANGADTWWNRNKEYVDVVNVTDAPVDVKGLVVADGWAKQAGDDNPKNCNTWTVNSVPGVTEVEGKLMLPGRHTVRVYSGAGTPAVSGEGGRFHLVYMNSKCGYRGHYLNNTGDTVWISKGGDSEAKTYNFDNGYYVR
ncbi:hypothetical protein [Nonomuraea indica]|uniref:hypothetical protein n=1 Tax=Nonomuraea indica TaxID=1581193 RepID=UPI000C79A6EF|nr:hypothetical protein [Nonomuraea indica]